MIFLGGGGNAKSSVRGCEGLGKCLSGRREGGQVGMCHCKRLAWTSPTSSRLQCNPGLTMQNMFHGVEVNHATARTSGVLKAEARQCSSVVNIYTLITCMLHRQVRQPTPGRF